VLSPSPREPGAVFIELGARDELVALRARVEELEQLLREHRSRAVQAAGGPLAHPEDHPDFPGCRI